MKSVAIVGKMAAGKTTLSNLLVEQGWSRASLAGKLKWLAAEVYNGGSTIDKNGTYFVTSPGGANRPVSGRVLLQELGQVVKAMDRDFWIRWLVAGFEGQPGPWIVDDCRFPYEAAALRERGFVIAKIVTPDEERMRRYARIYGREPTFEELNHESETNVDRIDQDVLFDGTREPERNAELLQYFLR